MAAPSKRNALVNVTVEDTDALDCGVCWLPLKPPIFQCQVGHVFCLPCRDKLVQTSARCPVCGGEIVDDDGAYRRNHGLEKLLASIRVPCPNAARGCSAKPAYYDRQAHVKTCPCRPCHCPATACCFAGSKAKLLQHFPSVHRWPLTKLTHRRWQVIQLRHGFNVLDVGDSYDAAKRLICLLLVVSSGRRLGCAIYPVCLDAGGGGIDGCDLELDVSRHNDETDSGDCPA
ncbi:E3 ubiquitin-protein ligase SINA-like 10 [Brachypodium distachyon]|uniref:E3 ubiquitin-protein ligase SINA-like 10 n=1 Tax=Brachypodium distachyon TaxID=15368 RepID=UPI00052FF8EF|nr:E3 ubiquitin-protein ligase SINA-like 10 [Brachypodium distachyon]|eukprot:XP_024314585.1 E3 ubiquitin-protein ligase SINA-like 10 [Brachypodium distachyon]